MTKYIDQNIAYYDTKGEPLSGGKLNFYEAGTTTRLPVYSDEDLVTALSNPVIADSDGRFAVMYMQQEIYKIVLTDCNDVTISTIDDADYTNQALFDDIKQPATTTYAGVVKLATPQEVATGTDNEKAVTPFAISEAIESLAISPNGYINGGVSSYNTTSIIDISDFNARSNDDTQDLEVSAGSLDITLTGSYASGVVPTLTDTSLFIWADYNGGSQRFILDDATGSNIGQPKKRAGAFITNGSSNIVEFTSSELSGGSINTEYESDILETLVVGSMPFSVPNGIPVFPIITVSIGLGTNTTGNFDFIINNKSYIELSKIGETGRNQNTNTIRDIITSTATLDTTGTINTGVGVEVISTQGFIDGRIL